MTNATAYWGIAGGTGNDATCNTMASSTAATCNGNGDGNILTAVSGGNEIFRFWQHLANAGPIEGNYDGVTHGGTSFSATALNSPAGKITNSYWGTYYWGAVTGNSYMFDGQYDNLFVFGGLVTNNIPHGYILKPEEAFNIDTKLDDGKPAMGKIVMRANLGWAACTDAAASTTLTANYLLTSTAFTCALVFRSGVLGDSKVR